MQRSGEIAIRHFPAGEIYLRYQTLVSGLSLILVWTFDWPKVMHAAPLISEWTYGKSAFR